MTPKERWLALLERRRPDRIPTDYQATPEVTARLLRDLACAGEEALWQRLSVDRRKFVEPVWLPGVERREAGGTGAADTVATESLPDMWGIRYRKADYAGGSYDEPSHQPLAAAHSVEEIHAHAWPQPDQFDYGAVTRAVDEDDGYRPIHSGCYEPFLLYGYLRGLQTALEDLLLRPEIAEAILGRIVDFYYEHHRRWFEAGRGKILLTWVAEDLGAQTGPLMSLATYRRFLLPNQVRMAELARRFGVHVMYHTDGAARLFLPDLVDRVRIEILNPIQWRCPGMERERLAADFGDRVIFHGSIDNQRTLAFGSVDDVVEEVRQSVRIYRNVRWICGPCHNLQPVTPTENVVAMYETIHALGGA
jgi:uroporphyrinogen decarboxylase